MSTALPLRIHTPLLFPFPPLHSCSPHSNSNSKSKSKSKSFFKLSFKISPNFSFRSLRLPLETAILAAEDGASMPCIRRYENDLVRLSIYGSIDFTLAVTAAAADGGVAAEEHLEEGLDVMVIESLFHGSSDPRSTVSTSLVLPAAKVKEKGRQIGRDVINDVLSRTQSKQILAMAFRQVVMHQLLHVELDFFKPRPKRDIEDLESPREVALAEILDMFLDDRYTLPNKELPCGTLKNVRKMTNHKRRYPLWGLLMTAVASAVFSVALAVSWQLASRHLFSNKQSHPADYNKLISSAEYNTHISPEATGAQHHSLETMEETLEGTLLATSLETLEEGTKLKTFCAEIVRKIKNSYGWGGNITSTAGLGTWIGELPGYFKSNHESGDSRQDEQVKEPRLDIASYKVVLSLQGKIVGFQPTSGVAVNNWAANPLARELYGGKRLSPGLFEPRLQISKPDGIIVLELLMSVNPDAYFALARPAGLPFSTS